MAAASIPFSPMELSDWAVICQVWPPVPSAIVAIWNWAVGAQ